VTTITLANGVALTADTQECQNTCEIPFSVLHTVFWGAIRTITYRQFALVPRDNMLRSQSPFAFQVQK
jgi:hypothetical protein